MLIQKCFDRTVVLRSNMTSVCIYYLWTKNNLSQCPKVQAQRMYISAYFSKPIKKLKLSKLTKWLSIGMTNFWDISRSFVCNLRLRKQIIELMPIWYALNLLLTATNNLFGIFERQFFPKFKQIQKTILCILF